MLGLVLTGLGGFAAIGSVVISQTVTNTPSAASPDVIFQNGSGYTAINAAGFATLALTGSGAHADLAFNGIPGAASVALNNLLRMKDQSGTLSYTVDLARGSLPAAITGLTITIKNGASTVATWNAFSASTLAQFTMTPGMVLDFSVSVVISAATPVGALSAFDITASISPV